MKFISIKSTIVVILSLMLFFPKYALSNGSNIIKGIKVTQGKNETIVTIEGEYGSYRAFTMEHPPRLIMDFQGTKASPELQKSFDLRDPVVSKIRVGEAPNKIRIVIDSASEKEPFHYNIRRVEDKLQIRCWLPGKREEKVAKKEIQMEKPAPLFPKKELSDLLGLTRREEKAKTKRIPKYTGARLQTIDFYKEDLHNVFRLFGEITGKNFIVDDSVQGSLTLSLRDVPWDLALDIITEMKNLKQELRDGIIIIKPKTESSKKEGELVVKPFSEQALYPAKIRQKEMKQEQEARELTLRAHNLEQEGDLEGALKLYEDAFMRFRGNIELAKKSAYLHYRLGHYAKSYFFSKEALKINTQDPEAALYAALSSVQLKRNDEAKIFFEAATNSRPYLKEAFYNYGLFLEENGNYSGALYQFQRYEQIFGPSLDVGLAIARLYEVENKRAEACKKYRELSFSGFPTDRGTEDMIREKIRLLCGQGG